MTTRFFTLLMLVLAAPVSVCGQNPAPPRLQFTEPAEPGRRADQSFVITWDAAIPAGQALLSLNYSDTPFHQSNWPIAQDIPVQTGPGSYTWNTDLADSGTWYINGVLDDGVNPPVRITHRVPITIWHPRDNRPPNGSIVEPSQWGAIAAQTFKVIFRAADPDHRAIWRLYYDNDRGGLNGTMIAGGHEEDGLVTVDWDVTAATPGTYWIYLEVNDGLAAPLYLYSDAPVTVAPPGRKVRPFIFLTKPDRQQEFSPGMYAIRWRDADPDSDARINLYWSPDGINDLRPIALGLPEAGEKGSYIWDTTSASSGTWVIAASIEDGETLPYRTRSAGSVFVENIAANQPPTAGVTRPVDRVETRDGVEICWSVADPEDQPGVSIGVDSDQTGFDGPIIFTQEKAPREGCMYWNVRGMAPGEYTPFVIANDGVHPPVRSYGQGRVVVAPRPPPNQAPGIVILSPGRNDPPVSGAAFRIVWSDSDDDSSASIALYYSPVPFAPEKDWTLIARDIPEDSPSDEYSWDISGLDPGEYWVIGEIDDGVNEPRAGQSRGPLIIQHGSGSGQQPPDAGGDPDGDDWMDANPGDCGPVTGCEPPAPTPRKVTVDEHTGPGGSCGCGFSRPSHSTEWKHLCCLGAFVLVLWGLRRTAWMDKMKHI
ncbi:MAG: hypothetical protein GMKNLPBB_01680 [Myxococcota bacterium]|nr:hypothetical protein [Myxococcota bacterium]